MKRLAMVIALVLATAFPISASGSDIQNPVEQESPNFFDNNCGIDPANPACDPSTWVRNPTACIWDVDDWDDAFTTTAVINGTLTVSLCVIADEFDSYAGDNKRWGAKVVSKSSALDIHVTSSLRETWLSGPPVKVDHGQFAYEVCGGEMRDHAYPTQGPFDAIADSNGGVGKRIDFTLSVTSPKKVTGNMVVFQTYGLDILRPFGDVCSGA